MSCRRCASVEAGASTLQPASNTFLTFATADNRNCHEVDRRSQRLPAGITRCCYGQRRPGTSPENDVVVWASLVNPRTMIAFSPASNGSGWCIECIRVEPLHVKIYLRRDHEIACLERRIPDEGRMIEIAQNRKATLGQRRRADAPRQFGPKRPCLVR